MKVNEKKWCYVCLHDSRFRGSIKAETLFCTCSFCCYVNVSVDCTITYSGGNNY